MGPRVQTLRIEDSCGAHSWSRLRKLDDNELSSASSSASTTNVQMNASAKRKLEHQQAKEVPVVWVNDNEWKAIESAFDAVSELRQHSTSSGSSSAATTLPMVPSALPPSSPAAVHHRFYHHPSRAGHSPVVSRQIVRPESLKRREDRCGTIIGRNPNGDGEASAWNKVVRLPCEFQITRPESLKQTEYHCRTGHGGASEWKNAGHAPVLAPESILPESLKQRECYCRTGGGSNLNGDGRASPWKKAVGLPCQFPTRSMGGGGTTRVQAASESSEIPPNDGTSSEERVLSATRPLESLEFNFRPGALDPEMGVGPGPNNSDPLSQLTTVIATNPEEGNRESSKKQQTRRLPAWMEPARRFLFPVENSSSGKQARDVSGLIERVTNSETLEERISRASADQVGYAESAPQQAENGHPVWFQLEQPQLGLPWGLQSSSCVDDIKPKFPVLQFRGQIVYSKTESEVNAATDELWRRVRELQETAEGAIPIGFDLEWRASFEKGEIPRKVAVLQLCLDGRRCDVMQIIYSGIPSSLQNLLEAPSTLKVGVGVLGDASKLRQDYQITTRKLADLRVIANEKMKNLKQWGLSSLALELTGRQVEKAKNIRCSDWEALPLSEPQLQYAATDAFASLHLYQVLASFPDPGRENNQNRSDPEPPIT